MESRLPCVHEPHLEGHVSGDGCQREKTRHLDGLAALLYNKNRDFNTRDLSDYTAFGGSKDCISSSSASERFIGTSGVRIPNFRFITLLPVITFTFAFYVVV